MAKDGWVKTGARGSTTEAREGIIIHMGGTSVSFGLDTHQDTDSPFFYPAAGSPIL